MNTQDINKNTAAPSVTIAPRNPARGALHFVVTLTTHKDVRAYPCRSMESALKQPAQALVAPNWAFAGQRIELGPDELVLQSLMIPLLEMPSATPYGRSLSR